MHKSEIEASRKPGFLRYWGDDIDQAVEVPKLTGSCVYINSMGERILVTKDEIDSLITCLRAAKRAMR